jgi:hypothetical protein
LCVSQEGGSRGGDPLAQKILKFEGSFGEILSIPNPIIKMMFDVASIINNFDNVEVPTATTFKRITSSSR